MEKTDIKPKSAGEYAAMIFLVVLISAGVFVPIYFFDEGDGHIGNCKEGLNKNAVNAENAECTSGVAKKPLQREKQVFKE